MKIPVFITARMSSERLPKKHFLMLSERPILIHIILRAQHFGFDPILCIPLAEQLYFLTESGGFKAFGGDPDNVETRLIECATHYDIKHFHHLDGDDPFFDEFAVIDSFTAGANLSRVYPSCQSKTGSGRVGTTYNMHQHAKDSRMLLDRLEEYPWPQRLTLDYPEDYHLILALDRMLGPASYMAPRKVVDQLFINNPDLYRINWFRTAEWKQRQNNERK